MHRLSIVQALSLWMSLEDALHGRANYGGDVAEIYVYRLMSSKPLADEYRSRLGQSQDLARVTTGIVGIEGKAAYLEASEILHNLLVYFAEKRHASIGIETYRYGAWTFVEIGEWMKAVEETHRWHVQVRPRSERS